MGIDTAHYKALAFGVSALYTGVAGALAAIVVQFINPEFLLVLALGGAPRRAGRRRRRLAARRAGRRRLHHVRAEHRRGGVQGPVGGGLRHHPDPLDVRHADGRRRSVRAAAGQSSAASGRHQTSTERATEFREEYDAHQKNASASAGAADGTRRRAGTRRGGRGRRHAGGHRYRDQDRQHRALFRSGLGLFDDRQDHRGLFQEGERRRRGQRPKADAGLATTTAIRRPRRSSRPASWSKATRCCWSSSRWERRRTRRSAST